MERVNRLINEPEFATYLSRIASYEKKRRFCRHDYDHFLGVARVAYIYLLEQGEYIDKEIVYGAAMLHDIGRWIEYEKGEDHALASARLALPLLQRAGFSKDEIQIILQGILEHRHHHGENLSKLGKALALADDWVRECCTCQVQRECHKFDARRLKLVY